MKQKINKLIEISEYLNDNESVIRLKRLAESLEDHSYMLAIMGEFSAGKSSLINNLLGRQILPVHKTETTARITFIKFGEEEQVELVHTDGTSKFVSIEESLDLWQTGEKADLVESIESIMINLPSDLLKNGLIIADTPGTNTVIDKHIELTEDLIVSSDRVLYVLGKQITETDKRFVKAIQDFGTSIVFARTFMDQIKKNEEQINDTIEKERAILSEISSEEMFFLSNEKNSEYFNEIYSLQAYLSCTIAENVGKAIQESVASKLEFIIKKQEGKILDRRMELSMFLNSGREEYQLNKMEILSMLEKLENNLEQKRKQLKDKYEKEKTNAKDDLNIIKRTEEKKLIIKINNTPEDAFTPEYQEELGQMIRESSICMRDGYVACFERIIRENKVSFIEEMKQQNEFAVWIPDIPDSLEESDIQMNSLKDRMLALRELKDGLQEELEEIELKNQSIKSKNEELEEERKVIEESLETIQNQLDSFPPYVARYITLKGDHSYEKGFKVVGNIVDWATILIPGATWAKFGGKILNVGAKGAKAVKAVKAADAFADGARVLAKVAKAAESGKKVAKSAKGIEKGARAVVDAIDLANKGKKAILTNKIGDQIGLSAEEFIRDTNGVLDEYSPIVAEESAPTLLDYIDLGYWFSKIGKNFDTPDTKVVDTEYENKYFSAKQEIEKDMRLQARREFEKRKQLEELKTKEEENRLLKEITERKERSAQEQIRELEKEIEQEKKAALLKHIRNHYTDAVKDNLNHMEEYILKDILPKINIKMENYINTYDFRIKDDILAKKQELEELDKKFNSSERTDVEKESIICKEYSDFLETSLI